MQLPLLIGTSIFTAITGIACGSIAFWGPVELSRPQEHIFQALLIAFTIGTTALISIMTGRK